MQHEIVQLADGWPGTDLTVQWVYKLVEDSLLDPAVHAFAEDAVRDVAERDKAGECQAISDYVRSHTKYRNEGIEKLKAPKIQVREINRYGFVQGDCDDFCILWITMHRVLGHPARVQVISQRRDKRGNHIYGEVYCPSHPKAKQDGWVTDDCIKKDSPIGWEAPSRMVTKKKTYNMRPRDFDGVPRVSGAVRSLAPATVGIGGSRDADCYCGKCTGLG